MNKKQLQLGMNPSTASHRLVKDILWYQVVQYETCYHCDKTMTRDTFSIEHKTPWLNSQDPLGLFFSQENIAFSHHSCNSAAACNPNKAATEEERYANLQANRRRCRVKNYDSAKRRAQYLRTGN